MDRIAARFQKTRDETFTETREVNGQQKKVNHTLGLFSLGGATREDEWNYAHQKLLRVCGVVAIENQARI
jgi:formate dehydrogenase major subunit